MGSPRQPGPFIIAVHLYHKMQCTFDQTRQGAGGQGFLKSTTILLIKMTADDGPLTRSVNDVKRVE